MRIQFGSGRTSCCPLTLTQIAGNLSTGNTYYFFFQQMNDIGFNLPSTSSSITVTSNQGIRITLPSDAYRVGESWRKFCISVSTTDDASTAKILLLIDAVNSSLLPLDIDITEDAHISTEVATSTLPTGADLIDGMIRTYSPLGANFRYSLTSTATVDGESVLGATSGRWLLHRRGFESFISTTLDVLRGCDISLIDITNDNVIEDFDYALDNSAGLKRTYWIFNETNIAIPESKRVGLTVTNAGEDVTPTYFSLLKTVFKGHFDQTTGSLITTLADDTTPFPYLDTIEEFTANAANLKIRRDLEQNQAWVLEVYPEFSINQLGSSSLPALNSEIHIIPFTYSNLGVFTELGSFLGDTILSENSGLRRVYPGAGLGAEVASGTGVVNSFFFEDAPASQALGLLANTNNQILAINTNGEVYVVASLASNERQRALISTIAGESIASSFSSEIEGNSDPAIDISVTYPATIRSSFNDVVAGSSSGSFNAEEIIVYIRKRNSSGGAIEETRQYTGFSPSNLVSDTFNFQYSSGTVFTGTIPNVEFGLYSPSTPTVNSVTNTTGTFFFDVAVSFNYTGNSITNIDHNISSGNIAELDVDFSTLANSQAYWKAPVSNLTALSNLNATELTDAATYPVRSDIDNLVSLYRYDASDTQIPDGDGIVDAVNGLGNFLKVNRGNQVYYVASSGVPLSSLGLVGDLAVNVEGDLYEKTGASTWTLRGSLKGPTGNAGADGINGADGSDGVDGISSISITSSNFTQPVAGSTVSVSVDSTDGFTVGQYIFTSEQGGNTYQIDSISNTTSFTLLNPTEFTTNSSSGTVLATGAKFVPAGSKGDAGQNGNDGADGTDGINAISITSADYTQPAEGATVSVSVDSSQGFISGQYVTGENGGNYQIDSIPNTTTLVLQNLPGLGNPSSGTNITTGSKIVPSGPAGPTGATGSISAASGISLTNLGSAPSLTAGVTKLFALASGGFRWILESGAEYFGAALNVAQTWTKAQRSQVVSLSISSGTVTIDCEASNMLELTLTENVNTLVFNNLNAGFNSTLHVLQDNTGNYTFSGWALGTKFPGAAPPVIPTAANSHMIMSLQSLDGSNLIVSYLEVQPTT